MAQVCFWYFFCKSHSPCRKKKIFKKQKEQTLDQILTQKGQHWTRYWLYNISAVESVLVQDLGVLNQYLVQCLHQHPVQNYLLILPEVIVFFDMFKITDSLKGRKNSDFQKLSGCLKWGFRKENGIFFCLVYVGERQTQRREYKKGKLQQKTERFFFFLWEKWIVQIKAFVLFENCKTLFVFGRGKGHIREDDLLWQNILSCFFGKKQKTIHKYGGGGFSKRRVKPKTSPFSQRCFGRGLWKAVYYLWSTKAVFCWKHYCLVFSAKHSFCKLQKTEINQKQWVVFQHARRCFLVWVFYCMFGLGWLVLVWGGLVGCVFGTVNVLVFVF